MERAAVFNNPGAAAPEQSVENAINGSGSLDQRLAEFSFEGTAPFCFVCRFSFLSCVVIEIVVRKVY